MEVFEAKSGIVVLFNKVDSPFVDIRYFVRCGSADEKNKNEYGLAHALEHMFFRGTTKRNYRQLNHDTRRMGGDSNAFTQSDRTCFLMNVPFNRFEEGFEILSDTLYNSTFDENLWELEKGAILSEIKSVIEDPMAELELHTYNDILGERLGHPIAGCEENIQKARVEELVRFKNDYYRGSNVFLVITGGVSLREVKKVVNKYDRLDAGQPKKRDFSVKDIKFNMRDLSLERKGIEQSHIYLVQPVRIKSDLEDFNSAIAVECLSNHLFNRLREENGLCYGIDASRTTEFPKLAFIEITTSVDNFLLKDALKEIRSAVNDLGKSGNLKNDLIEEAYGTAYRQMLSFADSIGSLNNAMGQYYTEGKVVDPLDHIYGILKKTTPRGIKAAARKLFKMDNFKVSTMCPEG